jgi:hypothetical protein
MIILHSSYMRTFPSLWKHPDDKPKGQREPILNYCNEQEYFDVMSWLAVRCATVLFGNQGKTRQARPLSVSGYRELARSPIKSHDFSSISFCTHHLNRIPPARPLALYLSCLNLLLLPGHLGAWEKPSRLD